MFKLWKQIVKEININKSIWSRTIGGGLLDEPGMRFAFGRESGNAKQTYLSVQKSNAYNTFLYSDTMIA